MLDTQRGPSRATAMVQAYRREALGSELVSIDLAIVRRNPETVLICAIWSERERGKGHASRALSRLCGLADKFQVALNAVPYWLRYDTESSPPLYTPEEEARLDALNELNLSNAQLKAWYGRFGFNCIEGQALPDDEHPEMTRTPRPPPALSEQQAKS
jgi:hypothetical protein